MEMNADLGVLLARQVETTLLLGQLGDPLQHALPLPCFCPLPGSHDLCHDLHSTYSSVSHTDSHIHLYNLTLASADPACFTAYR